MGDNQTVLVSEPEMSKDQLKSQLLELIKAEKSAFKKVLDAYYQKPNPPQEEYLALNKKLIHSLSRVFKFYDANDGDDSLFLRNTVKPLREALNEAKAIRDELEGGGGVNEGAADAHEEKLPKEHVMLYITLYQSGGHDLTKWETQLKSLVKVVQSRPIYEDMDSARRAVRKSMSLNSEAYVAISVKKDAIIRGGSMEPRRDRYGIELVTLKPDAIQGEEAVREFVLGERHFRYSGGKLIAIESSKGSFFG